MMTTNNADTSRSWYSVSRKLTGLVLGIDIPAEAQDGIGEFADAERIADFCSLYLDHPDMHPIVRAECVDAILSSLALCIEDDTADTQILDLVRVVVVDAQHNVWAAGALLSYENADPSIDPGNRAVHEWLKSLKDFDFELIRSQHSRLEDPTDYLD